MYKNISFSKPARHIFLCRLFATLLVLYLHIGNCSGEELKFTILHSSDEHSSMVPTPFSEYLNGQENDAIGGFARLANLVKRIRKEKAEQPVILLSSGDFHGGTPFSWLALASLTPELDLMREIGYTATTLGNHEFDHGSENLADYLKRASNNTSAPTIICSNLEIPANHPMNQTPVKRSHSITLENGLKIGIIALLGDDAQRVSPAAKPLQFSGQHQAAIREISSLKATGAELIIALTHAGYYEDIELAKAVSGIDLILGGHNHIVTEPPLKIDKTLIMHSGAYLKTIGQLELAFDRSEKKLRLCNQETKTSFIHHLTSEVGEDDVTKKLVEKQIENLQKMIADSTDGIFSNISQTSVKSDFPLTRHKAGSETSIGNFITDIMRLEVEKVTGQKVDLALHANGIIRGDLVPASSANVKGNISLYDLITLSSLGVGKDNRPGYALVSFYLTESEILNLLEIGTLLPMLWNDVYFLQFSGIRYRYDPDRAFWFWIPIINKPLPAYSSVLSAERYCGSGIQTDSEFKPLKKGSSELCHVVTTHYLASYLPMVGKKLPRLNLVLKNRKGEPVELDQTIIKLEGREFKLWEATARYAASLVNPSGGAEKIPSSYEKVGARIIKEKGTSLWFWPVVICIATITAIFYFWRRRRKAKKALEDEVSTKG